MTMATRAAIYLRVSSRSQEDNYSLPTQEAACRAFAAERGWDVAGVYTDIHTRTELWERPHLSEMREAVRRHAIDAVVCYAIDRLSGDPVHLGVILSEADYAGVEVAFVTEPLDDSPEGQLIRFVRGYAAKVEHAKIKERTMRGRIARIESGKPPVGARPPYGYRWVDDRGQDGKLLKLRYEENPATAWVVRRIFTEIAAGSSARTVARRLTEDSIPTPTGGTSWIGTTISRLLKHPIYTGNATAWRWKKERVKGRGYVQTQRPESEHMLLPGVAPALVSPEAAKRAIAQLGQNKQQAVRNNSNPEAFLLRGGIARCGYCGGSLQATRHKFGQLYRCNGINRDRWGCPSFSISAKTLDGAVWEGICERLTRRDVIAAELERLRNQDPTRADLAALDQRIAEIERRQRNLMARLADEDNADLATLIRADLAVLVDERRRLDQERVELDRQREEWRLAQDRLAELDLWVQNVAANLDEFDYAKRRLALTELGATVRVWAKDHSPRWEVKLRPDALSAFDYESSQTSL
jgi:site-specific DNA recombinase